MIQLKREGVLLEPTDLYFENGGVFNPAVYQEGETVHLFYRGIQNGGVSMIGYCKLNGPLDLVYRSEEPFMVPEYSYEAYGVEDPRIVKIDDTWYLTYTAYDGKYALGALAISHDMVTFVKKGPMFPRMSYAQFLSSVDRAHVNGRYFDYREEYLWSKNFIFFPRRLDGKLYFIHRIRPGILIADIHELSELKEGFWTEYFRNLHRHILLDPLHRHGEAIIGGGCPPLETKEGWLLIYHSRLPTPKATSYSAYAVLLDLDNPRKVIARCPYPLFSPEAPWEKSGFVNNVVFPTGLSLFGNRLYIYYGCADTCIASASVNLDELLYELLH